MEKLEEELDMRKMAIRDLKEEAAKLKEAVKVCWYSYILMRSVESTTHSRHAFFNHRGRGICGRKRTSS